VDSHRAAGFLLSCGDAVLVNIDSFNIDSY
jgi:hypothetical protein